MYGSSLAGLGLYCHAPGGVGAPPGVTSVSSSRAGLRGGCRRTRQEIHGWLRARWDLRDTLTSPEAIAPGQTVRPHDGCHPYTPLLAPPVGNWYAPACTAHSRPRKRCRLAHKMAVGALPLRCRGVVWLLQVWT